MSINYKAIGIRIKEYRSQQHLQQETLAWDAEISASYLSGIENGKKRASLGAINRIAKALGISAECLLLEDMYCDDNNVLQELYVLLSGCSEIEQRVIVDAVVAAAVALKQSFRSNEVF